MAFLLRRRAYQWTTGEQAGALGLRGKEEPQEQSPRRCLAGPASARHSPVMLGMQPRLRRGGLTCVAQLWRAV